VATPRTIVVAGAGIGGLTASLALAAKGFRVVILEKAERLEEAGAGLQLSPNASRVLIELGLRPRLEPHVTTPEAVTMMSAQSGCEVARLPLGKAESFRVGAPYWVIHRADLQAALAAEIRNHPDIELHLGCQFECAASHANGITVGQRRGTTRREHTALALIGADGIWSAVRNQYFPEAQPQFSGLIAWRGTIDSDRLPREFNFPGVQLWMGSNAHVVAYPISGGRKINLVAIVSGSWNRPGWSAPGETIEIKNAFAAARWPGRIRMMIGAVDQWRRWALFTMPDGGVWSSGGVALLGDAAHGMLPFVAQGAGMAIEDAAVLAKCLAESHDPRGGASQGDVGSVSASLLRYAGQRKPRITRVQRTARQSGQIYHLQGPMALARDLVMRGLGGPRLLARNDWIYDWRA
jgi:salicylate hydroxylase